MNQYAIIETGSKQYRVAPGDTIVIEKLKGVEVGQQIEFQNVLLVSGDAPQLGKPYLPNARVIAEITKSYRGPKLHTFKYKRKTRHRRKIGHRQPYMGALIKEIRL